MKYIICLLFYFFQTQPNKTVVGNNKPLVLGGVKWKYTVYYLTLQTSTALPSISNPESSKTKVLRTEFIYHNSDSALRKYRGGFKLSSSAFSQKIIKIGIDSSKIK